MPDKDGEADRAAYGVYWRDGAICVMGTAEIMNGKIKYWRDYYANLRLRAQMS
jgi:limonene-1,2-epoxide hydrolase